MTSIVKKSINHFPLYLFLISIILFGASCKSGKELGAGSAYHKMALYVPSDYQKKLNAVINYVKDYEGYPYEICTYFVSDMDLFLYDIKTELEENERLSIQQTDSLRTVFKQTKAIKDFMHCLANCETDNPVIRSEDIRVAAALLGFQVEKKFAGRYCVDIIQVEKADFMVYFLSNKHPGNRQVPYSFQTLDGRSFVGNKTLKSGTAKAIYTRFNDQAFDYIQDISLQCK